MTRGTSGLYFQVSGCPNFQTPAKPASDWLEKKLARGKSWQNSRDELQNIEFNQSSAKAPKPCKSSARSSARSSVRSSAKALPKALPKALQHLCPPSVLTGGSKGVSPLKLHSKLCLKLCLKLYSKPYTELQSSTNTQH